MRYFWDAHEKRYQDQEESIPNFRWELKGKKGMNFIVYNVITRALDPVYLSADLTGHFILGGFSAVQVIWTKTTNGTDYTLHMKDISFIWYIELYTYRRTIQANKRLLPRNTSDISLNKMYQKSCRMIRYKHLNTVMYSTTMFWSKRTWISVQNYSCAHIFSKYFYLIKSYSTALERDMYLDFKKVFKKHPRAAFIYWHFYVNFPYVISN